MKKLIEILPVQTADHSSIEGQNINFTFNGLFEVYYEGSFKVMSI